MPRNANDEFAISLRMTDVVVIGIGLKVMGFWSLAGLTLFAAVFALVWEVGLEVLRRRPD